MNVFRQFKNPFAIDTSDKEALCCVSSGQQVAEDLTGYVEASLKLA